MSPSDRSCAVRVRIDKFDLGGRTVLRDLALDLPAGTWTCVMGPSGVGKSTLLRLIAGLETAPQAEVADAAGAALDGRVAWMAQTDLLLPWACLRENVALGARLRGVEDIRAVHTRARGLLEAVGLGDRASERPAALSGGMRQRVALARTLAEDRPVVLLDEPFAAVDALTRIGLQDLARRLLAGRTVLHVTHDAGEAVRIADRILILDGAPPRFDEIAVPAGQAPRPAADPASASAQAALVGRLLDRGSPDRGVPDGGRAAHAGGGR